MLARLRRKDSEKNKKQGGIQMNKIEIANKTMKIAVTLAALHTHTQLVY